MREYSHPICSTVEMASQSAASQNKNTRSKIKYEKKSHSSEDINYMAKKPQWLSQEWQ